MKKCPKCKSIFNDALDRCPDCGIALQVYEKDVKEKNIYQKIDSIIKKNTSNLKVYNIVILFAIVTGVIFVSYLIGFLFTNDVEYAEKEFLRKKHDFKDFISIEQTYDKLKSDEKSLNDEVAGIQRKLSAIEDFEKNKDKYNSEIQNLSEQTNNLAAQKTALETSLNDIENRLSQD